MCSWSRLTYDPNSRKSNSVNENLIVQSLLLMKWIEKGTNLVSASLYLTILPCLKCCEIARTSFVQSHLEFRPHISTWIPRSLFFSQVMKTWRQNCLFLYLEKWMSPSTLTFFTKKKEKMPKHTKPTVNRGGGSIMNSGCFPLAEIGALDKVAKMIRSSKPCQLLWQRWKNKCQKKTPKTLLGYNHCHLKCCCVLTSVCWVWTWLVNSVNF